MVLEQPIEAYEAPDPARQAAAGMDGAAKGFCAEFMPVQKKFPFTPKATEEVGREAMAALFARPNGSFWKLEAAVKPAVVFDGARYAANPQGTVKPSAQFLAALDRFSRFAREMYPENSPEPRLRFKLTWHELEQQLRLELTMDGQRASFSPQAPTKSFDWAAPANGRMQIALYAPSGGEPIRVFAFTGPWAPFKFTADANSENYVGGVAKLTWDERSGRSQYQVNVRPLTYQFSVDNPILTTRFLHEMTCVSQVASK
jgi:type VI protein secretion system component VasK